MSAPELLVEPHALRRLAGEADRVSGGRSRAAQKVRTAAPDPMMFGLYGETLVATLRRFLDAQATALQQCGQTWEAQADGVRTHLRDCARVDEAIVDDFGALLAKVRS